MKNLKHFMLTMLMAFISSVSAFAFQFEVDGIIYKATDEWSSICEIVGYNGISGELMIPGEVFLDGYKNYMVSSIGECAFRDCIDITSVSFPDGLFSSGLNSIGDNAFIGCTGIRSLSIPESITYIGHGAFSDCTNLTFIEILSPVINFGINPFSGCINLTKIILSSESNFYVENDCLIKEGCLRAGLNKETIDIPNTVSTIDWYAFQGCCDIKTIIIPNSVTGFGQSPFNGCSSLTELIMRNPNPVNLDLFGRGAFSDISKTCTLYVPKGSLEAYQEADEWKEFENIVEYIPNIDVNGIRYKITSESESLCTVIAGDEKYSGDVEIPSTVEYNGQTYTVTTISSNAFYNCTELTSISIPRTITQIEKSAFTGCVGLTRVNIEDLEAWCGIDFGIFNYRNDTYDYNSNPLQYAHKIYLNGELITDLKIPSGVESINKYSFSGCTSIQSVFIPKTVNNIGGDAFDGCVNLSKVNIEDLSAWCKTSNGSVGSEDMYISNPLQYAHNLYLNGELVTDLEIPLDVSRIRDCAFYGCQSLTSVVIPLSLENIGCDAFYGCVNLKTVYNLKGWRSGSTAIKESWVTAYATNVYTNMYQVYDGKNDVAFTTDESQITKTSANALVFDLATVTVPTKENYINYKNQAGKITLTDSQPFYCPEDVTAEEISYTRTFSFAVWSAFYVPYNMPYNDWKSYGKMAKFSNIRQYDDDGDEVYERIVMEYELVKEGEELLPNVPYVFKPFNKGEVTFTSTNRIMKATPDVSHVVDCATTKYKYEVEGSYQTQVVNPGNVYYLSSTGNFSNRTTSSVNIGPFRITLTISAREGNYSSPSKTANLPSRIDINVIGETNSTGIEAIDTNGATEDVGFDLFGNRVNSFSKGLIIKKGKKILIK